MDFSRSIISSAPYVLDTSAGVPEAAAGAAAPDTGIFTGWLATNFSIFLSNATTNFCIVAAIAFSTIEEISTDTGITFASGVITGAGR